MERDKTGLVQGEFPYFVNPARRIAYRVGTVVPTGEFQDLSLKLAHGI
jgi:hypothetical protein